MKVEKPETVVMFSLKLLPGRGALSAARDSAGSRCAPFQLHVRVDAVQRLNGRVCLRHAALLRPEEQAVHVRELHPAPKREAV
jgi:hypothetical protein